MADESVVDWQSPDGLVSIRLLTRTDIDGTKSGHMTVRVSEVYYRTHPSPTGFLENLLEVIKAVFDIGGDTRIHVDSDKSDMHSIWVVEGPAIQLVDEQQFMLSVPQLVGV